MQSPRDLRAVLDAMLQAVAGQDAVIVVDEIQHAQPDALSLLIRLVALLDSGQRLLLLGRHAPAGLGPLRRDGTAAWLGTADLAMTSEEVAALWQDGFGLPMSTGRGRPAAVSHGWLDCRCRARSLSGSAGARRQPEGTGWRAWARARPRSARAWRPAVAVRSDK